MSNHDKALDFIKMLIAKFGKGGYIFRGTSKRYSLQKGENGIRDGINSTLYRWVIKEKTEEDSAEHKDPLNKIDVGDGLFLPEIIEAEIVDNARKMFPSKTANHEILTDLQHFGGKTNMMDFTRSMYVALFFACQSNYDQSGELIALHTDKLKKIDEVIYRRYPQKEGLEVIEPAGAQTSRQRVLFQSSVFIRPTDGYINPDLCDITEISAEIKTALSEYLQTFHNITASTVYNDLYGFISNEKNNETISLYLYLGLASCKKRKYNSALRYLNECLRHNPPLPMAYNARGTVYHAKEQYPLAIKDYDMAIHLKRDYAEAFYNRAISHFENKNSEFAIKDYGQALLFEPKDARVYAGLGDTYLALEDYERANQEYGKAIFHNSNYAKVYNARGAAFCKWYNALLKAGHTKDSAKDKLESAIKDFDMAIKLEPDFAKAYENRGKTKIEKGDAEGGKEDLAIADKLGKQLPLS